MNMAGELVLSRNQLLQGIARNDAKATEGAGKSIDAITSELQETVMLTRMQPIGILFSRFHRMVRDLARELRKEVEIDMAGKSVELDRTLIENLSDPLTHLVRNAVDHGIEPAEERKKLGKGEIGHIKLHAYHETGQIHIDISDDGTGIDPHQVAKAAVQKGVITREQLEIMSRKEKINLIFTPGFSTTDTISSVSGRGVGMDVVKNNLNRLGGQVDIASQPKMGTTIRIKLPLTMAIIPGQVISVEDQKFIIPQTNLVEILRIPADQVKQRLEWVGDAQVIRLRDQLLPLVRLTDVLGIERTYTDPSLAAPRPDRRRNIADRRSKKTPLFGSKRKKSRMHPKRRNDRSPGFNGTAGTGRTAHSTSPCFPPGSSGMALLWTGFSILRRLWSNPSAVT
ncbi:MAG: chemotaxis protein CheA [Deltaproteobacteria bacterium]|nr:chemotaxis protein CheA [Deltaproteobacteria bacterium]